MTYQGTNLVNRTGATLTVEFSEKTARLLTINSVDLTQSGLSIGSVSQYTASDTVIEVNYAAATNVALLQTRLDFTNEYMNTLETGSAKLTLADINLATINEEGANLLALQTRQQLSISALSFAGQAEQSVLQPFR